MIVRSCANKGNLPSKVEVNLVLNFYKFNKKLYKGYYWSNELIK